MAEELQQPEESDAKPPRISGRRPTHEEEQEKEDYAYELLSRCFHKSQIKKHFRERFGWVDLDTKTEPKEIKARQIESYIARARVRLQAEAARGRDEMRAESLSFYLAMVRDKICTPREKMQARERIDRLMGLDSPIKVAPTTPDGENEYAHLSDAELDDRIAAALESQSQA